MFRSVRANVGWDWGTSATTATRILPGNRKRVGQLLCTLRLHCTTSLVAPTAAAQQRHGAATRPSGSRQPRSTASRRAAQILFFCKPVDGSAKFHLETNGSYRLFYIVRDRFRFVPLTGKKRANPMHVYVTVSSLHSASLIAFHTKQPRTEKMYRRTGLVNLPLFANLEPVIIRAMSQKKAENLSGQGTLRFFCRQSYFLARMFRALKMRHRGIPTQCRTTQDTAGGSQYPDARTGVSACADHRRGLLFDPRNRGGYFSPRVRAARSGCSFAFGCGRKMRALSRPRSTGAIRSNWPGPSVRPSSSSYPFFGHRPQYF